jgi:zinc/manganese transport system permease protein
MTEGLTLHPVDWGIVGPALVAGLLVLLSHVPLGVRVLRKGIVFIDLAIAQIAGLGVITADALGFEPQGWGVQLAAVGAALLGAALLTWTERHWPDIQEALIGTLFVVASCLGLLMLAGNPHGGEHLKDLLVGQILWVRTEQLWGMAGVTAVVLLGLWGLSGLRQAPAHWQGWGFYALFALAVTASVQLVGVYLVFASLIMPALAVRRLSARQGLALGLAVGAGGYLAGLSLSAMLDWPSGAVVVLALAVVACAAGIAVGRALRTAPLANRPQAPT